MSKYQEALQIIPTMRFVPSTFRLLARRDNHCATNSIDSIHL